MTKLYSIHTFLSTVLSIKKLRQRSCGRLELKIENEKLSIVAVCSSNKNKITLSKFFLL